jgi:hypothetical protein
VEGEALIGAGGWDRANCLVWPVVRGLGPKTLPSPTRGHGRRSPAGDSGKIIGRTRKSRGPSADAKPTSPRTNRRVLMEFPGAKNMSESKKARNDEGLREWLARGATRRGGEEVASLR